MVRLPEHSIPPSQPASFRHLGMGLGQGGSRPPRAPWVVALVGVLVLAAVPVYIWRHPGPNAAAGADASASASALIKAPVHKDPREQLIEHALDGGVETPRIQLGRVWVDRCSDPRRKRLVGGQCDSQPFFERALVSAVLDNIACAPTVPQGGSISYALKVDYRRKRLDMFAGRSGSVRHRRAKNAIRCVKRSLPAPDWENLPHKHTNYVVAVIATYPPSETK